MNDATYLAIFEEARWELITERGYGLDKIRSSRMGPVILDATVKFRREVTNRQQIVVRSDLVEYKGKIGKFRQRLYKCGDAEELACEAMFTMALWDIDARKIVSPTPEWAYAVLLTDEPPHD